MQYLALLLINFYQKYLSPHKGFCCAHSALNNGDSCSEAVKKILKNHGFWTSYPLIKTRFNECKSAYQQLLDKNNPKDKDKKDKWYNYCDPSAACDVASCIPKKSCDLPDFPCDCSLF